MDTSIRLRAFAKINLGLRVVARRPDGYHEIRTVMQTVDLCDRLEIRLKRRYRTVDVLCHAPEGEAVPGGRRNLVYRACEAWRRRRGWRSGIEILLQKRIPAGSGLGGASSDAWVTLAGLERLTGDRLPTEEALLPLAEELGSDVPYFHWGGRALALGRGEEVYPLPDLPARHCLIAFPGEGFPTAEAYRQASLKLTAKRGKNRMEDGRGRPPFSLEKWGVVENDFEAVVFARRPQVGRVKKLLTDAGAEPASLSGSGAAVYGIFRDSQTLQQALDRLPRGWQAFQTQTLSRAAYQKRLVV